MGILSQKYNYFLLSGRVKSEVNFTQPRGYEDVIGKV